MDLMGRKLVLTGTTLTDLTAPKIAEYDFMESAGSLWLAEPMHPYQQWAAGVPADLGTVPNIVGPKAQALLGTSVSTDFEVRAAGMAGAQGKVERTTKGGLHVIYSNTNATNIAAGGTCYFYIRPPANVRSYLLANYGTHKYFMSMWMNTTRLAPSGKQPTVHGQIGSSTSTSSAYKLFIGASGAAMTASNDGARTASSTTSSGLLGPKINNVARSGYTGGALPGGVETFAFQVGNSGVMNSYSTAKEGVASQVLYRTYVEDLTVSGRTYAEADALDFAEYTKQVLTPGGRYYGDTIPTDPATIP
jgi:hypothetical protein